MIKVIRKWEGYLELAAVIALVVLALLALFTSRGRKRLLTAEKWADRIILVWRSRRRKIEKNLSLLRPDLTKVDLASKVRQVARSVATDTIFVIHHQDPDLFEGTVRVGAGLRQVAALQKAGKKLVIVGDHRGPFDAAGQVLQELDLRLTAVVQHLPLFGWLFDRSRRRWGANLIHIRGGNTYQKALASQEAGDVMLTFIDIVRPPGKSEVEYQAGQARVGFATLPARLAWNADAVFTLEMYWDPLTRVLDIDALPFAFQRTADYEADVLLVTQQLGEVVMEKIRRQPGVWIQAATLTLVAA